MIVTETTAATTATVEQELKLTNHCPYQKIKINTPAPEQ
jgi:hypothetical protein